MKKLLCKIFGHKFDEGVCDPFPTGGGYYAGMGGGSIGVNCYKVCQRCSRIENFREKWD